MSASPAPRVRVAPRAAETFGDLAGGLAAGYGLTPDDWQQWILDDWLARAHGRWASLKCGLSVPRQNGKNGTLEVRELFGMIGRGEQILHTAHQVKTAQKHFRRLKSFFGNRADDPNARFPELNALVGELRNVNGQEAIYLKNGASVEIVARSQGSGRGFTVDVIVCDEAQDMSDDDLEALLSTSSAGRLGDPQWIFTGTPPGPKANGEVFARNRAEALDGKARKVAWHEWAADPADDIDAREVWEKANPGLVTGRLLIDVVDGERGTFSQEGFMRERLGMWSTGASSRVIPSRSWADAADETSVAVDRMALGVEVGPDAQWASVAIAGRRSDGDWHIELDERVERTDPTDDREFEDRVVDWVAERLEKNAQIRAVVVDAGSPSAVLFPAFAKAKIRIIQPRVRELGIGCTQLLQGVVTGSVHHIRQPQMTGAVGIAGKRRLGDTGMWVFSRASAHSDITPIQAAVLALIGSQSAKVASPTKRARKVVVYT